MPPGPQKKYSSYFPQIPMTTEQRLTLALIANVQGVSITDVLRESWDEYCETERVRNIIAHASGIKQITIHEAQEIK